MSRFFVGLWQHRDFRNLWLAETVSLLGSQITLLALPLTAVLILHANPIQMGILRALSTLPALFFGIFVGVFVDRLRRRPLLIVADIGRAMLLASLPCAAFLNILSIGQIYLVAFAVGFFSLVFDVAQTSLLPDLVQSKDLVEGNSKMESSRSAAMLIGPGIAGVLVQALTAPIAIIIDTLSFIGSALFLRRIPVKEEAISLQHNTSLWRDARNGLSLLLRHPILRALATSLALYNFFSAMLNAIYILYVITVLHVSPALLGLIYSIGSIGFLIGATSAGMVGRRFGIGATIIWGACLSDAAFLLIPLAPHVLVLAGIVLTLAQFLATLAGPVTAITQTSLRQRITPSLIQGRVNGAQRFISASLAPLGALIGGILGVKLGLLPTLLIAASGIQLGFLRLFFSPVRGYRAADS